MSKKLLVVEDSKPIARVIKQIALSLNYDVTVATSLKEVETILATNNDFFAATIDYSLPDAMDGEAIPYVLSHKIPGLVLTGKMDEKTREKILAQPVIDYIPKENSQAFLYLKRILSWQLTNSNNSILVVDDSKAARSYIKELLTRRNFTVYVAENGQEALEVLSKQDDIKLVITDLEMPIMDGITLSNEIRKIYTREQLSIVGISGSSNGIHSARFIKNGADDFLHKPFCPEEFYCRVTQNIDNLNNIEQIQKAANIDYLTELPNRRSFFVNAEERLPKYINNNVPYCLATLDIDYFKTINENYGQEAGDHVLKVLALYMRKHLGTGLLARMGGGEFCVLMPGVDEDQLYNKLDDLRRDISVAQLTYEEQHITFSISIGVTFNSTELLPVQIGEADIALYSAKENGRNQISISGSEE